MSALIRLSSKLPGEPETNGLDSYHERLLKNPHQIVVSVVWHEVSEITQPIARADADAGPKRVTVVTRRIEPIGPAESLPRDFVRLVSELGEKRLGKAPLPIDEISTSGYEVLDGEEDDGDE